MRAFFDVFISVLALEDEIWLWGGSCWVERRRGVDSMCVEILWSLEYLRFTGLVLDKEDLLDVDVRRECPEALQLDSMGGSWLVEAAAGFAVGTGMVSLSFVCNLEPPKAFAFNRLLEGKFVSWET